MLIQINPTLSHIMTFCVATYSVTVLAFSHLGFPWDYLPAISLRTPHSGLLPKLLFRQSSTANIQLKYYQNPQRGTHCIKPSRHIECSALNNILSKLF